MHVSLGEPMNAFLLVCPGSGNAGSQGMRVVSFRRYHQFYEVVMPHFPFSVKMKKQLPLGRIGA